MTKKPSIIQDSYKKPRTKTNHEMNFSRLAGFKRRSLTRVFRTIDAKFSGIPWRPANGFRGSQIWTATTWRTRSRRLETSGWVTTVSDDERDGSCGCTELRWLAASPDKHKSLFYYRDLRQKKTFINPWYF